jgi:hypothetical protein
MTRAAPHRTSPSASHTQPPTTSAKPPITAGRRAVITSSGRCWLRSGPRPQSCGQLAGLYFYTSPPTSRTYYSAADRVILGCRGADIRVRRACRTRPVAPHGKADRGSRRRGERGAPSGTPRCCRNSRTSPGCRLSAGCLETRGDPGQAEGYRPRNHPASQASAGGQAPGTSRRSPPVRSQSPGRSKVRLPGMSAPCHAVTLSDTGRHGERTHCRRSGRFGLRRCPVFKTSVAGCSVRPHADGVRPGWDAGRRWVRSRSGTGSGRIRGQREPDQRA